MVSRYKIGILALLPHRDAGAVELYAEDGLWGARSPSGRVLTEPGWQYLHIMGDDVLIAKQQTADGLRTGLIRTNGELLMPFLYDSIEQEGDNLWAARFREEGRSQYHLYRSDGTRWSDTAWSSLEVDREGNAILTADRCSLAIRLNGDRLSRTAWHSVHSVGLHTLRLDFDAAQLAALPDSDTLLHLGDAAADYLTYLSISDRQIDRALFSGENPDALDAAPRYKDCYLQSAAVNRLRLLTTTGFPVYLMQLQVTYRREAAEGAQGEIRTAMYLTVSRNAAGGYTYSGFSDPLSELLR